VQTAIISLEHYEFADRQTKPAGVGWLN
jgi:hypothetical protein